VREENTMTDEVSDAGGTTGRSHLPVAGLLSVRV
jgi:hypothetical protein